MPSEGAFCDMMWSDPAEIDTWRHSNRGAGYLFGGKVTAEFNHLNGLDLVARAHQLVLDGFQYWFKDASLATVWSAPNYCYRCGNAASILEVNEFLDRDFKIFYEAHNTKSDAKNFAKDMPYFL